MASIISAGTTDSTSLNVSGDKSGILQLASNNATVALTIDTSQNVGIGTASPSYKLDVSGVGRIGNGVAQGDPNSTNILATAHTILSGYGGNFLAFGQYGSGNGYAQWIQSSYTNPTTATYNIVLNPLGGNVGVGTNSPSAKLQVSVGNVSTFGQVSNAGLAVTGAGATGNYAQIGLGYAGTNQPAAIGYVTTIQTGYTYGDLVFGTRSVNTDTAPTERMRLDSSGNFMVGTSTSGGIITASGAQGGSAVIRSINTTSSGGVAGVVSVLQSNGNNTSSSHFLGSTTGINNWYLYGNGTTSYSSDIRLKKNVQTARGYLNDIARLRVVKYQWIGDNPDCQQVELGLIAQEVEEVFPNLIQEHEVEGVGMRKNIKQSVLPFMLIKSIQELKAINDTQAETINALIARIEALENK